MGTVTILFLTTCRLLTVEIHYYFDVRNLFRLGTEHNSALRVCMRVGMPKSCLKLVTLSHYNLIYEIECKLKLVSWH